MEAYNLVSAEPGGLISIADIDVAKRPQRGFAKGAGA